MNPLSSSSSSRVTALTIPLSSGFASSAAPLTRNPLTRAGKAAREFEAQLLGTLLDPLEKTFAAVPGGNTPGADDYNYLGSQALAQTLAASGGFGIGKMIDRYLEAHEGTR